MKRIKNYGELTDKLREVRLDTNIDRCHRMIDAIILELTLYVTSATIENNLIDPEESGDKVMIVTLDDQSKHRAFCWFSKEVTIRVADVKGLSLKNCQDLLAEKEEVYLSSAK